MNRGRLGWLLLAAASFHLASFLGAFLLFLLEPLIAKQLLPWFGGSASVWSTCLVFFQVLLVVGYAYAHVTRRLGVTRQAACHVVLLALVALTLPIIASPAWKPPDADSPAWRLLRILILTVGAPYGVLSATAPLLQDWYRRVVPDRSPYLLYALSNTGSLTALLSYPAILERWFTGHTLAIAWSVGFLVFTLLAGWSAWCAARAHVAVPSAGQPATTIPTRPSRPDGLMWVSLAACGSALLLAATNQLCQDVAAVPLLWVVPLAVYLATYVIGFAGFYSRVLWAVLYAVAVGLTIHALRYPFGASLAFQVAAILFVLFAGCMLCHGELARLAPPAVELTSFYLRIAIGGSLGGLFVGLVAPLLFTTYLEFPLLIAAVFGLLIAVLARDAVRRRGRGAALVMAVPVVVTTVALAVALRGQHGTAVVAQSRNFYGVLTVVRTTASEAPATRELMNGRVLHGSQLLDLVDSQRPTTYYAEGTGVDFAIRRHPRRMAGLPLTIGVVGLGAGTVAAWGEPGDLFRFFEINPLDAEFARRYFSFLGHSRADVEVVLGDGRLSLERELEQRGGHRYDVLVLDAFSGDSIPVHLLTREAFALYRKVLSTDGVLAVHVSNLHVNLEPVVRGLAAESGLTPIRVVRRPDVRLAISASVWMLVTANPAFHLERSASAGPAEELPPVIWTDDFSSLVRVLR